MSIKIIHTADWHLGGNYPEKAQASAEYLVAQIHDETSPAYNPDVICLTGDLTNHSIHVHSEHLAPFLYLVNNVTCPIVLLQGTPSHEPFGTINNIAALSKRLYIVDEPGIEYTFGERLRISGLPALTRPQLAQWATEAGAEFDGFADPEAAIRLLLKLQGDKWASRQNCRKVFLGHWTVAGCVTPTGQTMPGNDLSIGLDELALTGANAVLLGHIHQSQDWSGEQLVTYSGPPYPTSWGELHQTSFSVLEFDDETGKLASFVRIPFPHKPMAKFDVEFTGEQRDGEWVAKLDEAEWERIKAIPDAEVKCCYSVPKEIAAQVDDMLVRTMFLSRGLELAAVERTIKSSSRERIADIASKETTRQQYEAVCTAKGEDPRPGALTKADTLDEAGIGL